MTYQHSLDPNGMASAIGDEGETLFEKVCKANGYRYIKNIGTKKDIIGHADYSVSFNTFNYVTVDVKGRKKATRQDSNPTNKCWIELWSKGRPGWLYGPEDYVAFLNPVRDAFLVVNKESLRMYAEKVCFGSVYTFDPKDAYHKQYVRTTDKVDILSMLTYKEIMDNCNNFIMEIK